MTDDEKEILSHGIADAELHLRSALDRILAADQKAGTLTNVFLTISTGIVGAIAALGASDNLSIDIMATTLSMIVMFFIAATFCMSAALPGKIWLPGLRPGFWEEAAEHKYSLIEIKSYKLKQYSSNIDDNEAYISRKSFKYKIGAYLGVSAPIVGLLVYSSFWLTNLSW